MADITPICVTVAAGTMPELRARRDAQTPGTLVELRLDMVDAPDVGGALGGRRNPVLVTCRPAWEGGRFTGSEEERRQLLHAALREGAEYVDVEWTAYEPAAFSDQERRRLVLSLHDFSRMPDDLGSRLGAMRAAGPGVVKVAVMAHSLADTVRLRDMTASLEGPKAVIAMGEAGVASRILAARFGSCWSYASDADAVAPGQLSVERLRREFRFETITARTAVYGVLGKPVSHSVSPAMHNAAFAASGLDAVYLPLAADSFDDFQMFARAFDVRGVSVTAPYKVDAYHAASSRDARGERAQSINTLRRAGPGWDGLNSDHDGFLAPLADVRLDGLRATVLGAGGAARTVALALKERGALVTIVSRRNAQARDTAALAGVAAGPSPVPHGSWDLLVNATPVGTAPAVDESPLPAAAIDGAIVYDLVYNPPRTRLMADAAARGCRVIGGLEMLVAQAQAQSAWWTGVRPPADILRDAARARLEEMRSR